MGVSWWCRDVPFSGAGSSGKRGTFAGPPGTGLGARQGQGRAARIDECIDIWSSWVPARDTARDTARDRAGRPGTQPGTGLGGQGHSQGHRGTRDLGPGGQGHSQGHRGNRERRAGGSGKRGTRDGEPGKGDSGTEEIYTFDHILENSRVAAPRPP